METFYFKKPVQPGHLYLIDIESAGEYERVMLASLQGITAKKVPCIWLLSKNASHAIWLNEIIKKFNVSTETMDSPWDLLARLKGQVAGYILYELGDEKSLNAATTLAGVKKAVLIDRSIEDKAVAAGLRKVFDASGLGDEWTYEEAQGKMGYGENEYSRQVLLEQRASPGDARSYTLRDYAVFCNAVTCHQGATKLMSDFVKLLDKQAICLGWGEYAKGGEWTECGMGSIAAKEGVLRIASDWAFNLTVMSAFPPVCRQMKQKPISCKDGNGNAHTVTIMWTDGDNIQWMLNGFNDEKFWRSRSRGKFNLGWGINNVLYEAAPTALEYYYDTASRTDQGCDYFVMGPQFAYALDWMDNLPEYVRRLNESMRASGLEYALLNELCTLEKKPELIDLYTSQPDIKGLFYFEYDQYDRHRGKILWSNGKPVVTCKYMIWDGVRSPAQTAELLNGLPAGASEQDSFSFITVHAWSEWTTDDIYEMTRQLNPNIDVVTPDVFMQRLIKRRQINKH